MVIVSGDSCRKGLSIFIIIKGDRMVLDISKVLDDVFEGKSIVSVNQ